MNLEAEYSSRDEFYREVRIALRNRIVRVETSAEVVYLPSRQLGFQWTRTTSMRVLLGMIVLAVIPLIVSFTLPKGDSQVMSAGIFLVVLLATIPVWALIRRAEIQFGYQPEALGSAQPGSQSRPFSLLVALPVKKSDPALESFLEALERAAEQESPPAAGAFQIAARKETEPLVRLAGKAVTVFLGLLILLGIASRPPGSVGEWIKILLLAAAVWLLVSPSWSSTPPALRRAIAAFSEGDLEDSRKFVEEYLHDPENADSGVADQEPDDYRPAARGLLKYLEFRLGEAVDLAEAPSFKTVQEFYAQQATL